MENKRPSVYEECRQKGISRRDFLKFCTTMAALMGLEASGVAQVVNALETKPRLPIIWLHLQECTCCTESFIRAAHPIVATLLLDKISLDYTETLMVCTCWGARQSGSGSLSAGKSSGSGVYIVYENGRKLDRRGDDSTSHRALGGRFPLVRLETSRFAIG